MKKSTKKFVFFGIIYFFLHACMFPARCFRQRKYVGQEHMNWAHNKTGTNSSRLVRRLTNLHSCSLVSPMFSDGNRKLETHPSVRTK